MDTRELSPEAQERLQALRRHLSDTQQAALAGGDPIAIALNQVYLPLILAQARQIEELSFRLDVVEKVLDG